MLLLEISLSRPYCGAVWAMRASVLLWAPAGDASPLSVWQRLLDEALVGTMASLGELRRALESAPVKILTVPVSCLGVSWS